MTTPWRWITAVSVGLPFLIFVVGLALRLVWRRPTQGKVTNQWLNEHVGDQDRES